jgi:hypothetical protein
MKKMLVFLSAIPIVLQVEHGLTERWSVGLSAYYERYAYEYSFIPLFGTNRSSIREDMGLVSGIIRGNYHFGKKKVALTPILAAV